MSKPTSYDLLLEITKSMNRLEDKLDAKIQDLAKRTDKNESKVDNLLGKIGVGVMMLSIFTAGLFNLVIEFFKKKA